MLGETDNLRSHTLLPPPPGAMSPEDRVVAAYVAAEERMYDIATRPPITPHIEGFQAHFDYMRARDLHPLLARIPLEARIETRVRGFEASIEFWKEKLADPLIRISIGAFMLNRIENLSDQRLLFVTRGTMLEGTPSEAVQP